MAPKPKADPKRRGLKKSAVGPSPSAVDRHWAALLFGLFLIALALRLAWALKAHVTPWGDSAEYDELARNWMATGQFGRPGAWAWRTPGYPAFLALVYRLFGPEVRVAMVAQAGLGAVTCLLVALLGARAAGRRVGLTAGALYAVSMSSILYTPFTVSEHVAIPLALGALLCLSRVESVGRHAIPWAALSGALLGAAVLARPAALFLAPVWIALVALKLPLRRLVAPAGAICLGAFVVLSPWLIRNVRLGLGPTVSTIGGFDLWMGNHDGATGGWDSKAVWTWTGSHPEAEQDRIWLRTGLDWMRRHPGQYGELCLRRLWRLALAPDSYLAIWSWPTSRNDYAQSIYVRRAPGLTDEIAHDAIMARARGERVLGAIRWLVAPLTLVAFVVALKRWREYAMVLLPLGTYVTAIVLTVAQPRYREMLGPFCVILIASLLDCVPAAWRRARDARRLPERT